MSIHCTSWVLKHSEATAGARLVLLVLADHAKDDGTYSWPAVETIAHEARMTRRGAQLALRRLEDDDSIVARGTTRAGTTIYNIVMEAGGAVSSPPLVGDADDDTPGANVATKGGEDDDVNLSQSSPEPSEPSKEPSKNNSSVREVWDHYVQIFDASRQSLDSTRTTMIRNALKARSVEDCKRAIDGLHISPYHNGDNRQRQKYLDIRYALKGNARAGESAEARIDKMGNLAPVAGDGVDQGRAIALLEDVQQAVLQGVEVERGRAAKERLEAMGFVVKKEPGRVWMERAA